VPDLGADLVRVYAIDQQSNSLTEAEPLKAEAGSGPRHGAFSLDPISGYYIFYLVAEITSTVTAYRVSYEAAISGMSFDEIGVYSTLAPGEPIPPSNTGESTGVGSEVAVSVRYFTLFFLS
jgi:6-phosphogluconolactonase (cycloisomerase 2 family)